MGNKIHYLNLTYIDLLEILDQIGEWCYIRDEDYRVIFQNSAMKKELGVWEGRKCHAMIYSSTSPCSCCDRELCIGGRSLQRHIEVKGIDKVIACNYADLGHIVKEGYLLVMCHDITGLVRDLELKSEKEKIYKNLFEHVPCGVYVSTGSGRFLEVNNALVNMLGYGSKEELLSVDIGKDLYRDLNEREKFRNKVESQGYVDGYEVEFKRKDGKLINVMLSSYVRDDAVYGEFTYQGIIVDLTHIKEMERELKRRDYFMKNVINSSADTILVIDMDGKILLMNPSAFELLSVPENHPAASLNITMFMDKKDRKKILKSLLEEKSHGKIGPMRVTLFDYNKNPIPVELTSSLLTLESRDLGIMTIIRDMRPTLELEERLERTKLQAAISEKMASIGRLAAGVAHEINNPLGAILMQAHLALEELDENSRAREALSKVIKQTERCAGIVRKLLEFAREREPRRTSVDVNGAINQVLELFEHHPLFHNIEIQKELRVGLPPIKGDLTQIQEVFMNLIVNAAEAMEGRGRIHVETSFKNGFVEVHVSDSGPGVPPSDRERIFEPFFTTKVEKNGTGLGLAVSHGIVTAHGGQIFVEEAPEGGACFVVKLPLEGVPETKENS